MWPPVWKRAVHLVYCACHLQAFVKFCGCPSFPFGIEGRVWDLIVLIPDHCLSVYYKYPLCQLRNCRMKGRTFRSVIRSVFHKN